MLSLKYGSCDETDIGKEILLCIKKCGPGFTRWFLIVDKILHFPVPLVINL